MRLRTILIYILCIAALVACRHNSTITELSPQVGPPTCLNSVIDNNMSDSLATAKMERYIRNWLTRNRIRGAALAITKDDRLIYCKGFGVADSSTGEPVRPGSLFRIASASKLITATAVMRLCEEGLLSLDDNVFGAGGLLPDSAYCAAVVDSRALLITVHHLLDHTSGISRRLGDPMFHTAEMVKRTRLGRAPTAEDIIAYTLSQRLRSTPGTTSQYSNVGYLILSQIIERVSCMSYEEYVQKHVLEPAECYDMHLAYNEPQQRYAGEVSYYGADPDEMIEAFDGSGELRPREYGGNNIRGLQGAGAWVASVVELSRFVAAIDGNGSKPDILQPSSIAHMTERQADEDHSFGWARCNKHSFIRTGTMSGTCAYIECCDNGYTYVMLTNTSSYMGPRFTSAIGRVIATAVSRVTEWDTSRDLFETATDNTMAVVVNRPTSAAHK